LIAGHANGKVILSSETKRALLESNPPRDNWIERRRNKNRLHIWGGHHLPKWKRQTFISEPEYASKTHRPRSHQAPNRQPKTIGKKSLSFFSHPAFHAEPVHSRVLQESNESKESINLHPGIHLIREFAAL
jgi:hypothetical protein